MEKVIPIPCFPIEGDLKVEHFYLYLHSPIARLIEDYSEGKSIHVWARYVYRPGRKVLKVKSDFPYDKQKVVVDSQTRRARLLEWPKGLQRV